MLFVYLRKFSYSLSTAFRITLGTTDPKNIYGSPVPAEEAAIIIAVSVNPTNESFRCPQSKFHPVLATHLTH